MFLTVPVLQLFDYLLRYVGGGLFQRRDVHESHAGGVQLARQVDVVEYRIQLFAGYHNIDDLLFHLHRDTQQAEPFPDPAAPGIQHGRALGAGVLGCLDDGVAEAALYLASDAAATPTRRVVNSGPSEGRKGMLQPNARNWMSEVSTQAIARPVGRASSAAISPSITDSITIN